MFVRTGNAEAFIKGAPAACCCSLVIYSLIMGMLFSALEYNEVGIKFDRNINQLDIATEYSNGLYFLGYNQEFIRYSKVQHTHTQSVNARTQDGLRLSLDVAYQWKIIPTKENIIDLYLTYNGLHETLFTDEMHSMIQIVSSEFNSFQYFEDRESIGELIILLYLSPVPFTDFKTEDMIVSLSVYLNQLQHLHSLNLRFC